MSFGWVFSHPCLTLLIVTTWCREVPSMIMSHAGWRGVCVCVLKFFVLQVPDSSARPLPGPSHHTLCSTRHVEEARDWDCHGVLPPLTAGWQLGEGKEPCDHMVVVWAYNVPKLLWCECGLISFRTSSLHTFKAQTVLLSKRGSRILACILYTVKLCACRVIHTWGAPPPRVF